METENDYELEDIFAHLDQFISQPITEGDITMEMLRERYSRSNAALYSMMNKLVEKGEYETRVAFDEVNRRHIRVWRQKD